jgi:cGMP-dependent protein kinase 1
MGTKVTKQKVIKSNHLGTTHADKFKSKNSSLSARVSYDSVKTSYDNVTPILTPKGNEINTTVKGKNSINPTTSRINNKKQKIIVKKRSLDTRDHSEVDILQIVNKNNYEYNDYDMINNCLIKHFFMRSLDKEARKEIIKEMTLCKVEKGQTIFKQGSIGNFFYIVKEGEVHLFINDNFIKNFIPGESFGELALLHNAVRSGSVIAKEDTYLYCLERRNFRKIVDHIKLLNYEENKKFINSTSILTSLEPDLKLTLANNLIKEHYESGMYIVKEGEIGGCLYIIKDGQVECSTKGKFIRTLEKGDHFGEKSILMDTVRTMDVKAKTDCQIYSITIDTIKCLAGDNYKNVLYLNIIKKAFSVSKYFNKINVKLIENAFECFEFMNYNQNEVIIKAGLVMSTKIIIIVQGNVLNKKINQVVAKTGEILFEEQIANLSNEKYNYDLVAEPDCLIAEVTTENFLKFLGGSNSFKEILKISNALDSIGKIPLFKSFPQKKLETLSNIIKIQNFENGKRIIKQGEVDDKFYIIKSGKVDIYVNSSYARTLNVYESFGERALFFSEPRTATAQANGPVELYVLLAKDFKSILEDNLSEYLKNRLYLQDSSIELKDLDFVTELGSGSFGNVSLVKSRKTKFQYAIKSISKKQIDHEQLHSNLDLERKILLRIDHPFIVKLVKTLKSDRHIFFLMEYIRGKELFDVIRDIGILSKSQTQFYGGSLLLAINYLHERKYIYRDIKPENVMVSLNVNLS